MERFKKLLGVAPLDEYEIALENGYFSFDTKPDISNISLPKEANEQRLVKLPPEANRPTNLQN